MPYRPSESPSPTRKRQRLSSPTYDDQIGDLSQDDISAFDKFDAKLSQCSPSRTSQRTDVKCITHDLSGSKGDSDDNPFQVSDASSAFVPSSLLIDAAKRTDGSRIHASASPAIAAFPGMGFQSASALTIKPPPEDDYRSPSPDAPPEIDHSSWFEPNVAAMSFAFTTAKVVNPSQGSPGGFTGFKKLSGKGLLIPSTEALLKAQEKMKRWETDTDDTSSYAVINDEPEVSTSSAKPNSSIRPIFTAMENSFVPGWVPETPTPAAQTESSLRLGGFSSFSTPSLIDSKGKGLMKPLPFRSPFISTSSKPAPTSSRSAPATTLHDRTMLTSQQSHFSSPALGSPAQLPLRGVVPMTPLRPFGLTPKTIPRTGKPKFVTPFKPGMRPGDLGHKDVEVLGNQKVPPSNIRSSAPTVIPSQASATSSKKCPAHKPIELTRISLSSRGLIPHSYNIRELNDMGIDLPNIQDFSPQRALEYRFPMLSNKASMGVEDSQTLTSGLIGPSFALDELHARGCTLATKEWVENHWSLILWKLAGLVAMDPLQESDSSKQKWCWREMMRQLTYRYERELNNASLPALRLMTTGDASPSSPMVLCISGITWSEASVNENGATVLPYPQLEVTDGWYRLRARVDETLARAIRRRVIRVGRKICVMGARLSSERKDPMEALAAYNSTALVLSGNSTHLAPWHAKLGFHKEPWIATLNSLNPDGGNVAMIAAVVIKAHPVAFIEFIQREDGSTRQEGPRTSKDEAIANERWMARREVETAKLWYQFKKRMDAMENHADRLAQRAGPSFSATDDDSMPTHIENLYDDLEDDDSRAKTMLATLSRRDAGWLAWYIRQKSDQERLQASDEFERELEGICPARQVRNFRVITVGDAYSKKYPPNRRAQITAWDVLNLTFSEGSEPGSFEAGQKFLVTNLIPTQKSAWMGRETDSEIYLTSRKDSRWTRI